MTQTQTPETNATRTPEDIAQLERFRRQRSKLLLTVPYYGNLACSLELKVDPTCRTAYTDGKVIGFNPTFTATLTDEELRGLICHEVLHCAYHHQHRRDGRDPYGWNVAADYAINDILFGDGLVLPEGALHDKRFAGMAAEQIYKILADEQQQDEQEDGDGTDGTDEGESTDDGDDAGEGEGDDGTGSGEGDDDGDEAGEGGGGGGGGAGQPADDDDGKQHPVGEVRDAPEDAPDENDWTQKVVTAGKIIDKLASQTPGTETGSMERIVEDAKRSQENWREILQQFMMANAKQDFDWQRPNRRYLHTGLYLPSLCSESVANIVIGVDTSGSIDDEALKVFLGELNGIVEQIDPEQVTVYACDRRIHDGRQVFERGETVAPKTNGGGGTRFAPVFDAVEENDYDAACLLYFTDGHATYPPEPDYPVLWVMQGSRHGSGNPPYGEVIYLEGGA
jgi:predicted metal-dependent peptidase